MTDDIYQELERAVKNHKITQSLEVNVRAALLERDAQAVRYIEQIKSLTADVARREQIEQERAGELRRLVGTSSLEHLIARYKELAANLKRSCAETVAKALSNSTDVALDVSDIGTMNDDDLFTSLELLGYAWDGSGWTISVEAEHAA